MKFYDTDTHEIFEASAAEFERYMELYHEDLRRDTIITGNAPHIFVPRCPSLKGHRHFAYKFDEEYVMIKFENKFVHFCWDEKLKGKQCFVADGMEDLRKDFEHGYLKTVESYYAEDYPFKAEPGFYRFAYYDPNYDCKIAYNEGKTIQGRTKRATTWKDIPFPEWTDDVEYRIKPEPVYAVVIVAGKLSSLHICQLTCQHIFFRGTQDECHNYIVEHEKFTECMVAHLFNKKLQSRAGIGCEWHDIDEPIWNPDYEYRIKPVLTWTDLRLGDTVRQFNGAITSMVTAFDMSKDTNHVQLAGWGWTSDSELAEKWYKI